MFIKVFNISEERVEYIRLKNIQNVYLTDDTSYDEESNSPIAIVSTINDKEYIIKVFCLEGDIEEDADLQVPKSFIKIMNSREEVKNEANKFLDTFMIKKFKIMDI